MESFAKTKLLNESGVEKSCQKITFVWIRYLFFSFLIQIEAFKCETWLHPLPKHWSTKCPLAFSNHRPDWIDEYNIVQVFSDNHNPSPIQICTQGERPKP